MPRLPSRHRKAVLATLALTALLLSPPPPATALLPTPPPTSTTQGSPPAVARPQTPSPPASPHPTPSPATTNQLRTPTPTRAAPLGTRSPPASPHPTPSPATTNQLRTPTPTRAAPLVTRSPPASPHPTPSPATTNQLRTPTPTGAAPLVTRSPTTAAPPTWRWPLDGQPVVIRRFNPPPEPWRAGHRGIDLAAPPGTTILAAGPGTVTFAGAIAGRGVVSIQHPGGLRTTYLPVQASVRRGQTVATGDRIGVLESTSWHCTASCLHWGLRRDFRYLDPLLLLGWGPIRLLPHWPTAPT
ncbi:peptidoglycan DD-metalloendopeptidase family protein [Nonomuraea sp. NPDC059194]|uniref:M23 family metallopeptidase n=1 Tax=Nonomuraea sp. NPDC059194 TaxID=3346764 RepID=UPI0036AED6BC